MGYEYRLTIHPPVYDLGTICNSVFATSPWQRIPTSLLDVPNGIGVQFGETPECPSWPHVADLYPESEQQIYVVCHVSNGKKFLDALVKQLQRQQNSVTIDDDV